MVATTCPPSSLVLTFVSALVSQEFVPTSLHKLKHYLFQIERLIIFPDYKSNIYPL